MNRPTIPALLVLGCAALLGACGDSGPAADRAAAGALRQTLDATSKIDNGRLMASFALEPDGLLALGGPIALRASGPFAAPAAGKLPRFDLAITGSIAGNRLRAGASSTGDAAYLRLGRRAYEIDDAALAPLRDGHAKRGALASLGLDPLTWIVDPTTNGHARVGGVDTIRIAGGIDVERLLGDIAKLLDGAGATGGLLTPKLREQIAAAVTSGRVDVWTGSEDRILRQLAIVVDFAFDKDAKPPIAGLDGGRIELRLRLDDVDATAVKVLAPKRARPLSELTGAGGLAAVLAGIGTGTTGGPRGHDDGAAFLRCLTAAGEKTADVMRCASKLAP